MRVALIGGTGFVGSYIVDTLLACSHRPSLLVRPGSESKVRHPAACRIVLGDVADAGSIRALLASVDAVIYLVGILRETPRENVTFEELQLCGVERTIEAARTAGLGRILLMSANGAAASGTAYERTKFAAEEAVAASGIDYTIFRPSVIFGDPRGRDEIATRLYRQMIRPPLPAVYFHTGLWPNPATVCLSPVHVQDVADAFVNALDDAAAAGQAFTFGGPATLSWQAMIRCIANAAGRRKLILPMPIGLMSAAAGVFDRWPWFPVTRDQLTMLASGNVAGDAPLCRLLGREPRAFTERNLSYLGGGHGPA